jgi:hypothetical protein
MKGLKQKLVAREDQERDSPRPTNEVQPHRRGNNSLDDEDNVYDYHCRPILFDDKWGLFMEGVAHVGCDHRTRPLVQDHSKQRTNPFCPTPSTLGMDKCLCYALSTNSFATTLSKEARAVRTRGPASAVRNCICHHSRPFCKTYGTVP